MSSVFSIIALSLLAAVVSTQAADIMKAFEVKLVDISKQDVPAESIAEQKITNPGQVPIPFELWYDPAKIDPRMTYAVQARIEQGGKLLFISTRVFPVITRGNSTHVEVKVDPVK